MLEPKERNWVEFEMAPVTYNLGEDLTEEEYHTLVGNKSVDSFILDHNQFTITRSFGDRKCSTMSFKQHASQENVMDVVITTSEYSTGKCESLVRTVTSQDIRRKHLSRAKCGVAFVLTMLLIMFVILVICLFSNSPPFKSKQSQSADLLTPTVKPFITESLSASNMSISNSTRAVTATHSTTTEVKAIT